MPLSPPRRASRDALLSLLVTRCCRFSRRAVVLHLHSAYLPYLRQASSSTWVNVKIIFTLASVCDLWGLNLFPIHSCELDTTKILCQVHLLSASSATYIFLGRRHDQTCRSTIDLLVHYILCEVTSNCVYLASSRRRLPD
jgi:hypothetical protein